MKRMSLSFALFAAVTSIAMPGAAEAQTIATATTDLNIRTGPGPEHPIIGSMRANQRSNVIGCIEDSFWCQIEFRGVRGWAYSRYMMLDSGGRRMVITEPAASRALAAVPTVTYRGPVAPVGTTGIAPAPAVSGVIEPAPAPTTVVSPALTPPPPPVGSYVAANPADPVYLEGEVVVGASLPQTVTLNPVPDYRYQYVYVNGQPVLVDPATRRIVYVFR